jgi:hypothetical protein
MALGTHRRAIAMVDVMTVERLFAASMVFGILVLAAVVYLLSAMAHSF